MPQFRFRLESLLKLREDERRQRRLELAEAFAAERQLLLQAQGVEAEIAAAKRKSRHVASPGELDVDQLVHLGRYILQLRAQSQIISQRQTRVREEVERRRLVLIEADRQVRTLEKLRDKQMQAFQREDERREQKILDEIAGRPKEKQDVF